VTDKESYRHGEQSLWPTMPYARESLIGGKREQTKAKPVCHGWGTDERMKYESKGDD